MFVLGISGPIGSGKSSIAKYFAEREVKIIDADEISHNISDESSLKRIEEIFGTDVFNEDKTLNRSKLAEIVFNNRILLDKLSLFIHKIVIKQTAMLLEKYEKMGEKLVVLDFPLPVKDGFLDKINYLIIAQTNREERIKRLIAKGFKKEDIMARMEVQMPSEEYEKLANKIINNDSNQKSLKRNFCSSKKKFSGQEELN